ncbi:MULTISPECIES: ABC transporter permease [Sporosarcina]|uniref:ABC transporter permease n=1 Tax=Sporosarcina contaminans TaxID=633403 RepID=A0ABW3U1A6_9BACL
MKNLRELWGKRLAHYMNELQKYMKFIFTGHLAVVLLFAIGAAGYAYSEWLKDVPAGFPSAILTAVVIGAALTFSAPVTLLQPPDSVFFLPLETKLDRYMNRALRYTFFSQLPLPLILFIVAMPLLSATGLGESNMYLLLTGIILLLVKWLYVHTEFYFRYANEGNGVLFDRIVRFVLAASLLYVVIEGHVFFIPVIGLVMAIYDVIFKMKSAKVPFPYRHFISLEQNRMMRFYRFANYFTDVPHLMGSVSRRSYLNFVLRPAIFGKTKPQQFLLRRTLLRTDDTFWLWVRLTLLSIVGIILIPFPIVITIFVGALSFATAIQLLHSLKADDDFRMDMLFPEVDQTRFQAIRKTVSSAQWVQTAAVLITAFFIYGFSLTPFILSIVVIVISQLTIRRTNLQTEYD